MINLKVKRIIVLFFSIFVIAGGVFYGYTQFLNKETVPTILQNQIDLNNPPEFVSAVLTENHKLSNGKIIHKGSLFIGMITREENHFVIYFDSVQEPGGNKIKLLSKSNLNVTTSNENNGISTKIGKTFHKQTRSNVLGAIFQNSQPGSDQSQDLVLPQGSALNIELN